MTRARFLLSVCIYSFPAFSALADDFTIDTAVTTTNGGAVLDGGDTITVTSGGSIAPPSGADGLLAAFGPDGGNVLTSSGTITTTGDNAHGFYHTGGNGSLTNSGSVTTGGNNAHGLYHRDDDGTITNSGSVTTIGTGSQGLYYLGDRGMVTNSGTVVTSGDSARGIQYTGDGGTLANTGMITTSGTNAEGMLHSGANGILTNSGTITTSGDNGRGVYHDGANGTFTNTGTIVTSGGGDAHGFIHRGDGGTFTNSGTIISENAYSIYFRGANATLNLNAGSVLQGQVVFQDAGTSTLNFGPGLNAVLDVNAVPATITAPGDAFVVDGTDIHVADITGFAASDRGGFAKGWLVQTAVENRERSAQVTRGAAGMRSWAQIVGGGFYAGGNSDAAGYGGYQGGLVFGLEQTDGSGIFGGLLTGEVGRSDAFSISSTGAYVGMHQTLGSGAELAVTFGVSDNTSERDVVNNAVPGGLETARASYDSIFVSPSLTTQAPFSLAGSSLRLRYTGLLSQGYTETGSSSNLTVESRLASMAEARLGLEKPLPSGFLLRYGGDMQYATADANDFLLAGTPVSVASANDGFAARGFLGVDFFRENASGNLMTGAVELGVSSDSQVDASFLFRVSF